MIGHAALVVDGGDTARCQRKKEINYERDDSVRFARVRFKERAVPITVLTHIAIQEQLDGKAVD